MIEPVSLASPALAGGHLYGAIILPVTGGTLSNKHQHSSSNITWIVQAS